MLAIISYYYKWSNNMNNSSREKLKIINNHVEDCPKLLIIRKMETKIVTFHFKPSKSANMTEDGNNVEKTLVVELQSDITSRNSNFSLF